MLSSGFVFLRSFFVDDNDDGSHIVDGKFIFRFFFVLLHPYLCFRRADLIMCRIGNIYIDSIIASKKNETNCCLFFELHSCL